MFYIKLEDDMRLVTTVYDPIYRGDNLNQKIVFLIPKTVNEIDVLSSVVYLNIIRADGEPDVVMLERADDMYNETYYQYVMPVTCKLSRYAGEVVTWLQIYTGDTSDPTVAKSSELTIRVLESKEIDDYISDWRRDKVLTALYQMKVQTDAEIAATNANVAENAQSIAVNMENISELYLFVADKADNLVFNEEDSTIQLTTHGEPIGNRIRVNATESRSINSVSLTTSGELVVFFSDGTYTNVGTVVGTDGKVYVPHVDEHKILTFTVEDAAGTVPDPVDLNVADEWSSVENEDSGRTDYVWDGMGGGGGNSGIVE